MMKYFMLIVFTICLKNIHAQDKNLCTSAETCGKCLLKGGDCFWCIEEDFKFNRTRCNTEANLAAQGCTDYGMGRGKKTNDADLDFTSVRQVKPQKVTLEIRPEEEQSFRIQVKSAKDYPVDLYYLMDLSKSMENDLDKLQTLGTNIAAEIGNITKNYRLAFGSFVDKTVIPFVENDDANYKPCAECEPTFSFKHVFDFSNDAKSFEKAVSEQKISGNLDTPEGGFDALMQVAVCEKEIGWNPKDKCRKIVVFVTDASPHIAGDGRIGGIIRPNDGQCYLTEDGDIKMYTEATKMDYPSIGFLRSKLKDNAVIPLFAVTKNVTEVYKSIAAELKDLQAVTGILEGDSSNIVEVIRDKVREISRTVTLTDDSSPDITVTYRVQNDPTKPNVCPSPVAPNRCEDVEIEQTVDFDVYVKASAKNCETKEKQDQTFTVNIPAFGKVEVNVKMICDCDCAKTSEPDSPKCDGQGTFECASCKCNEGRYGDRCICDGNENKDMSLCKPNNVTDKICSGFGNCVCGVCQCNIRENPEERIDGNYCQCNNFNCPRHQNIVCGGPERGSCECGTCVCREGYLGENCGKTDCRIGVKKCLDAKGQNCSLNGICECDRCLCDKGYEGKQCQTCVSCPGKCSEYKTCVLCKAFGETGEQCDGCELIQHVLVNRTNEECVVPVDENCFVIYRFEIDPVSMNETLYIQRDKRCIIIVKTKPPILAIVLGTIGGIVLLGLLLLLLWKLLITAYDNREFQKFEKDRMKSKWENDENPIYRPSKQQFQNPAYAGAN